MKKNNFIFWFWTVFFILVLMPVVIYFIINTEAFFHFCKNLISDTPSVPLSAETIEKRTKIAENIFPLLILMPAFFLGLLSVFARGFGAVVITRTAKGQKTFDKGWETDSINYGMGIDLITQKNDTNNK